MKRFFTLVLLAGIFLTACNTGNKQAAKDEKEGCCEKTEVLNVDDFLAKAADYVGKEVGIQGTVSHVCAHGGKRMFIFGNNPESKAKIVTGEDMASFDVALEGSDVCVYGVVEELRIDEAYLANWEAELEAKSTGEEAKEKGEAEVEHEKGKGSGHGEMADMGEHKAEMEKIKSYREKFAADSIDHVSYYTIVAKKFHKLEKTDAKDHAGCGGTEKAETAETEHAGCGEAKKTETDHAGCGDDKKTETES